MGQHLHDAAAEIARRGHRVRVLTSSQGYHDPSARYSEREVRDGVEIKRLGLSSFGKKSIFTRVAGGLSFLAQAACRGLITPDIAGVLVSTSPPMAPAAAFFLKKLRRVPIIFWAMDVNPDQAVATGKFSARSPAVIAFDALNRLFLRNARAVVALDRFMADRLRKKYDLRDKIEVIPPWPLIDEDRPPVDHEDNRFREEHGLNGKFVAMYSGNFSIVNPVTTILQAAIELQDDPDFVFLFVGGGNGLSDMKSFIETHQPKNVRLLPYQPLESLHFSLSAADIHLVSMGDNMVGIVHPCKVYGAMAVGRPIFYLGPDPSHISDLIKTHKIGWHVNHGDVKKAVRYLREAKAKGPSLLKEMGEKARSAVRNDFARNRLRTQFCNVLERGL